MNKPAFPEETLLTTRAVEKKAAKLQQLYMKRLKKHEGRRPKKELFILTAAYLLFKEKYPERKTGFTQLVDWLQGEYKNSTYDFDIKKLYKWKGRKPFKEMFWEESWDDLRTAQKISDKIKHKGRIKQRDDVMRPHSISRKELDNLIPLILSQNRNNKKTSDKFIFNRPDK